MQRCTLIPMLVFIAVAAPLFAGTAAHADSIRTWTDKDGVVHYTNVRPGQKNSKARYPWAGEDGVRVVVEGKSDKSVARGTKVERDLNRTRRNKFFDEHLQEACQRYRIPLAFAKAILAAESNFNPKAVSHAGAMGLMQLMPETAVTMYVDDIFDPRENIFGGVRYLRVLTNEFQGDLVRVIAAYNAGPEAVKRAGGVPEIAETRDYVQRVLLYYEQFKQQDGP